MESKLLSDYPWVETPVLASAPMMRIAMAPLAIAVSKAGGFGFVAGAFDLSNLAKDMDEAVDLLRKSSIPCRDGLLPIGIGFLNWGSDLSLALAAIRKHPPAAVWFFAPRQMADLLAWTREIRAVTDGKTKIWVQIGTVGEALEVAKTSKPDVIVVQGNDAGGHGLQQSAGIISLLPEVCDALEEEGIRIPLIAAGGMVDGRGVAAALTLGASGVAMGTRFLAAEEATIAKGYQNEILRAHDGGVNTLRSKIYDVVRGIMDWPITYGGRGVVNMTYLDSQSGMPDKENIRLYHDSIKQGDSGWGPEGRMTTYAGTGVGLVRKVASADIIIKEVSREALDVLQKVGARYHSRYREKS